MSLDNNPYLNDEENYPETILRPYNKFLLITAGSGFTMLSILYAASGRYDLIYHVIKGACTYAGLRLCVKTTKKKSFGGVCISALGYESLQALIGFGNVDINDVLFGDLLGGLLMMSVL